MSLTDGKIWCEIRQEWTTPEVRIERLEAYLTRAKAEWETEKARREAEAKKTAGQRTVEELIAPDGNYHVRITSPDEPIVTHFRFPVSDGALPATWIRDGAVQFLRRSMALAIDKAVATEREKCAQQAWACGCQSLGKAIQNRGAQ